MFPPLYRFLAGVSQVKWNRFHNNVLASAQGGEVRIWDLRVLSHLILYFLSAHAAAAC